jgi:hypothetical protein
MNSTNPGEGYETKGEDVTVERTADQTSPTSEPGRRERATRYRRSGALVVLAAAATILLAACGGGSDPLQIASLGTSTTLGTSSATSGGQDSTATTAGKDGSATTGSKGSPTTGDSNGNATAMLIEWTTCIRSHGDPNQVDPTIDSNKDINITMVNVSEAMASEVHGSTGPCSNYLVAAANVLRAGQPAPTAPDAAQAAKYVDCMRANGVPNYPNPSPDGKTDFYTAGVNPDSPIFEKADKLCSKKSGIPYYAPGAEAPGVVKVTSCNGGCPNGGRPPGSNGAPPARGNVPVRTSSNDG